MIIIYNKYFPFGKFWATNIFGIIFCRIDKGKLGKKDINHEYIHTLQQREMLYLGFMLWYSLEWLYRFIQKRSFMKAYYALYFEREAYDMESDLDYCKHRKPFGWWHLYVKKGTLLHELGSFIGEIVSFIRDDFKPLKYLYVVLLIASVIVGQTVFNIYDLIIAPSYKNGTSMLCLPLVYITMYYAVLLPTVLMHREGWRLRQWQLWVLPAFLVAVDGAGQGFNAYSEWIANSGATAGERYYMDLVSAFLFRSVGILTMLILFRKMTSGTFGLYGLVKSTKYLKVYGLIFLLLLPLFLVVSTTPQFLEFYPKMGINHCTGSFGMSNTALIGIFELCYANDFLGVESMFRGALVVGLSRWLGARSVLPMALTYMCIHLGKPDLELCSSVIGGYMLGILAFRTQHLWGGIIIHLGIAMLFEALGLLRC